MSLRVLDQDGRAVVIRHPKLGISTYPGGHIEGEDDLIEEARREFEEETGIDANLIELPSRIPVAVGVHEIPASAETLAHLHFDLLFEGVARAGIVDFPSPEGIECVWCRDEDLRATYRTLSRSVRPDEYTF
ncbi:MAG: NUDIX domain-containing protein [Fimbriimonas sp.]|nr:NUDIX domain-containing protein [Fimbriimonas sp.]